MTEEEKQVPAAGLGPSEIWERIQIEAGVSLNDVPSMVRVGWFTPPGGSKATRFEVAQSELMSGGNLTIIGIFADEDVYRVYAAQFLPPNAPPDVVRLSPIRLTLSRTAPTYSLEELSLDVMINIMAGELLMSAGGGEDDDEQIECPQCGTENDDDAKFCKECGAEMPADPEDEEKEEKPVHQAEVVPPQA